MRFGIRPRVKRLVAIEPRGADDTRRDMDDELRFFLDARIEQLVAQGMSLEDARAEAVHRLGRTLTGAREALATSAGIREQRMKTRQWVDDFVQDVRYAARGLRRRPGFTATAIITLAIGIGANTAIFSAVNTLLLRPLPFREPERLMEVNLVPPAEEGPIRGFAPWSWPKFAFYRDAQRSFTDIALWADEQFNITDGEAERVNGEEVSARYLATLGITPALGSDFPAEEDAHAGAARVVLISDGLWSRRFNSDPSAIGRTIDVDGTPYQVLGVLPRTFRGLSGRAEVLLPIAARSADDLNGAWSLEFWQIGRLNPGRSLQQAIAETEELGPRVYESSPMRLGASAASSSRDGRKSGWTAAARPLGAARVAPAVRRSLLVLLGAVGFVLLIACANLAGLLLARASMRHREIAVRIALGGGRGRLVRLLLTESLLLALCGGIASVAVAWWGTHALQAVNPQSALQVQRLAGLGVVSFSEIHLDGQALLFALGIAVVVGLLFGLVPAWQATRVALQDDLKAGRGDHRGYRRGNVRGRRAFIVAEVALALVLLVGAGLMIRSLGNQLRINPGFESANVLTVRLSISPAQIPRDSMPGFYDQLLGRLRGLPGVAQVALGDCPPLNGGCNATMIAFPNRPPLPPESRPEVGVHWVTPGWFSTMHVPLRRGRLLTDADRLGSARVIVISETAARKYWPNEDPLGSRANIFQGGFQDGATVVGVVGDVRYGTIDSLADPDVYISFDQSPRSRMMIFVRTTVDPTSVAASVRRVVRELSPNYPAYDVRPMSERVAAATAQARLSALLLGLFAAGALALAVVGIYGVLSFTVLQRTREIGIRMALGAEGSRVLRLVIGEGIVLAAVGAALGLLVALGLSRVLASLLFGVAPADPLTYAIVVVVIVGAAVLASWVPARRAAGVDPNTALRYD